MLYINLLVLIVFLIVAAKSQQKEKEWLDKLNKKEHPLILLYPISYLILTKTGLYKCLSKKKDISVYLRAFYNNTKTEFAARIFWCSRVSSVLLVLLAFNILSIISAIFSNSDLALIDSKYIKRPKHGEGKANVELQLKLINDDYGKEQNEYGPYRLKLSVNEKAYSDEELEDVFEQAYSYIKSKVLADNSSFDYVCSKLNFIKTVPGTSITVNWIPDNYNLIGPDGSVKNDGLASYGVWTNIRAILTYKNDNQNKSKEYTISLKIMPRQYSEEELLQKELKEKLEEADERSRYEDSFELPQRLDTFRLIWNEDKDNSNTLLIVMGIILAIIVWIGKEKELEKKLKQRKEQMLIDYPEIVNKFALLINAGMTIKQAWLKITDDYERLSSGKEDLRRYAYDEMLIAARKLRLGVAESQVYDQFGKSTGLIQYIKFTSLINQNLTKGTKGLGQQLMYEAKEAFEERKEIAKRLGETAGTRLLAPMMVMLVIVLLIIMIPAFMSFQI